MIWAYELLGIPLDADATAIKRAYARLLRTTRPDENAEAFQRLNTAYQMALSQAGRLAARLAAVPHMAPPSRALPERTAPMPTPPSDARPTAAPQPIVAPPASPPAPLETLKSARPPAPEAPRALESLHPPETIRSASAPASLEILKLAAPALKPAAPSVETLQPAAPRPVPTVDAAELAQRVVEEACRAEGPQALAHWLASCPELWSFRVKQITGQLMLQRLLHKPQPMPMASLDVLLHFFDFDHVLSGVNPVMLEQLRKRQLLHWEMLHDHSMAARRLRILTHRGQPDTKRFRDCLNLLQRPRRWKTTVVAALTSNKPLQLARIVQAFCNGQLQQLPSTIDRDHAQFWLRAESRHSREHLILNASRAFPAALGCALIVALVLSLVSLTGDSTPTTSWLGISIVTSTMFAGVVLGWAALYAAGWVDHWQCLPEAVTQPKPWRRRLFVPSLCALALTLDYLAGAPVTATFIVLGAITFSIRRYARRASVRIRLPVIKSRPLALLCLYLLLGGVMPILGGAMDLAKRGVFDRAPLLAIASALTLLVWSLDMWRHRALWRPKRAGS